MSPLKRLLSRFTTDRRGAVAVEFALILPVMLLFYLGTFEASQAIIAKRKVDSAAETVGGIIARSPAMNSTRMANVMLVSNALVGASGKDKLEITVTTVTVDADGKATIDWERRGSVAGRAKGTRYTLPTELRGIKDAYFVLSTVSYTHRPLFDFAIPETGLRFERTFSHRPRRGSVIPWS